MQTTVHMNLIQLLEINGVDFTQMDHQRTRTSEESASVRATPIEIGAKAIVMRITKRNGIHQFANFIIGANRKLDSKAIRAHFDAKTVRFASLEELYELTGLQPGSIPPFGRPLLPLDLYLDRALPEGTKIVAFNAGSLMSSVLMKTEDYLRIAEPTIFAFST